MTWDDVTKAELDAMDAPACGRPDYKGDTESPAAKEACQKEAWAWSIATICKVATYGAGGDVCEGMAGPIAYVTWPIVKHILMPLAEGMGTVIMAVLPDAWKASGVFCGECLIDEWYWGHTTFDPKTDVLKGFVVAWEDAFRAVYASWREALKIAGLPQDTPFRIQSSLIQPFFASERLEFHPDILALAPAKHPGNILVACNMASAGQPAPECIPKPPEYVTNAEQALVLWMDRYYKGTRTLAFKQFSDKRLVSNSIIPGSVADYGKWSPAAWGFGANGRGPMGIQIYGWPTKCDSGCKQDFAAAVIHCWNYRLAALARALPEVVAAAALQVAVLKQAAIDASKKAVDKGSRKSPIGLVNMSGAFLTRPEDSPEEAPRSSGLGGVLVGGAIMAVAVGLVVATLRIKPKAATAAAASEADVAHAQARFQGVTWFALLSPTGSAKVFRAGSPTPTFLVWRQGHLVGSERKAVPQRVLDDLEASLRSMRA